MSNILDSIQLSGSSYDLKDKNAPSVSAVTQQEYDNLPSSAKTSNTFFVITDAEAGDLTNYYTKSETSGATEISTALASKADTATTYNKTEVDTALASKQSTLESGTNIKTINNESLLGSGNIDIQGGGGSSYTAGDGIDITNNVISVSGVVMSSAITTSITSSSTDAQVPSAKAVYDAIGDIETLLSQI